MLGSLFNNVTGLKACNFIKKRLQHWCFPVNIAKLFKNSFFIEHLWWLLLKTNLKNFESSIFIFIFIISVRASFKTLLVQGSLSRKNLFYKNQKQSLKMFSIFRKIHRQTPVVEDFITSAFL